MPWFRILFLLTALAVTSGYTFRCRWMCTDETNIQQDYVAQRDQCRELAQLKVDTSSVPLDDIERKAKLTSYFGHCMAQSGWAVPGGEEKNPPKPMTPEEKASLMRSSECAFARADAATSAIAADRAAACNLECDQALEAEPEAPRPAACPAAIDDSMEEGYDTGESCP